MPPLLPLAMVFGAGALFSLLAGPGPLLALGVMLPATCLCLAMPGRLFPALAAWLAIGLLVGSLKAEPGEPLVAGGVRPHSGLVLSAPLPIGGGCRVEVGQVTALHLGRWREIPSRGPLLLRGRCPALSPGEKIQWRGALPGIGSGGVSVGGPGAGPGASPGAGPGASPGAGPGAGPRPTAGVGAGPLRARAESVARVGRQGVPFGPMRRLRDSALSRIQPWRDPGRAVVAAVALGQRDWLDAADRSALRITGTAHLMAISGMHVGLVSAMLFFGVRRAGACWGRLVQRIAAPRLAAALSLAGTWAFVFLCGAPASAMRAGFMVTAWLLGLLAWRRPDPWASLALGLIGVTLWEPAQWLTPGCQLSFAAVAGLIWAGRGAGRGAGREARCGAAVWDPLAEAQGASAASPWWRSLLSRSWELLRASAVATAATMPIAAYHFGQVTVLGLAANIVAVPIMCGLVVPLGVLGLVLGALLPWAGAALLALAAGLAEGLLAALGLLAGSLGPLLASSLVPSLAEVLAAYGFLVAIALRRSRRLALLFGLGAAILALCSLGMGSLGPGGGAAMRVEFLAVGDGDAILISFPDGSRGLVDAPGAGDPEGFAERRLVAALRRRKVGRLDFVVATHGHADHVGGLPAVLRHMPVGVLLHRGFGVGGQDWAPLLAEARRAGVPVAPACSARRGEVSLEVLGPPRLVRGSRAGSGAPSLGENDLSIVLRLAHAPGAVLLTGDLERPGEEALLGSGAQLGAAVLKAAHHGSRSATSDELLDRVSPAVVVITASAPRPGRPSPLPALQRRLRARGIVPLVTGLVGDVCVTIAPWGITVQTAAGDSFRFGPEPTPFLGRELPRGGGLEKGLLLGRAPSPARGLEMGPLLHGPGGIR